MEVGSDTTQRVRMGLNMFLVWLFSSKGENGFHSRQGWRKFQPSDAVAGCGSSWMWFNNVVTNANRRNGRLSTRISPTPTSANTGRDDPIRARPEARLTKMTAIQASTCP